MFYSSFYIFFNICMSFHFSYIWCLKKRNNLVKAEIWIYYTVKLTLKTESNDLLSNPLMVLSYLCSMHWCWYGVCQKNPFPFEWSAAKIMEKECCFHPCGTWNARCRTSRDALIQMPIQSSSCVSPFFYIVIAHSMFAHRNMQVEKNLAFWRDHRLNSRKRHQMTRVMKLNESDRKT